MFVGKMAKGFRNTKEKKIHNNNLRRDHDRL